MNTISKILAGASLAAAAMTALPASAQVTGAIGVVGAPGVVASTNAFRTAYQQIGTTYQAQTTQIQQKNQQAQTLLQQLDTNNDGNLDEAEQRAAQTAPQAQQIQTLETEVAQLTNQIEAARVYAIEQILRQYGAAIQDVQQQNNLQVILDRDAVVTAQPAAFIDEKVVAALNTRAPNVQITPPQGWQPSQQAVNMYQQITQILMVANARRQAEQQGQAQPAQQQPTGR
ncbi:MAG: OmpH family outer membrane protein [Pseudomonadota bacterium]|nr:OmpH family outer membrane protein [Pseudomonadota bacterium]